MTGSAAVLAVIRPPGRPGNGGARPWRAFALLAVVQAMLSTAASVTAIIGLDLAQDLSLSSSELVWANTSYLLAFAGLLLLGGRVADMVGWRPALVAGATVFAAGSLGAALATGPASLLLSRLLQGAGAAVAAPAAMALVGAVFPEVRARRRAMALWSGLPGVGAGAGLLLGGLCSTWASWRWAFALLAVLILMVAAVVPRLVPAGAPGRRAAVDLPGAALVSAGIALISYGAVAAGDRPWTAPLVALSFAAGTTLLVLFGLVESRARDPLLPPAVLRPRRRRVALVVAMLPPTAGMTIAFLVSLYLRQVLGWSVLGTALAFVSYPVALAVGSLVGGPAVARVGAPRAAALGLVLMAAGMAVLSLITVDSSYLDTVLPGLVLAQVGAGIASAAAVIVATDDVHPAQATVVGSLVNTAMLTGGTVGLAILTSLARARSGSLLDAAGPVATEGYAHAFRIAAIVFAIAAAIAVPLLRPDSRRAGDASIRATKPHLPETQPGARSIPPTRLWGAPMSAESRG